MARDTIVAAATSIQPAGLGVIRLSGSLAGSLAETLIRKELGLPRHMRLAEFFVQGECVDQGLVCFFESPSSYTGEDVVEISCHGSVYVVQALVNELIHLGARLARPGEFTERAFLNGKLDLAQAEAVADLISSESRAAAHASLQTLRGALSKRIHAVREELTTARVHCEANIDFSAEDISPENEERIRARVFKILKDLALLKESCQQGVILNQGVSVALIGPPNSGKSSMLNWLADDDVALVTDVPGTTRDVVKETLVLKGVKARVLDTAGIRDTHDQIEQLGIIKTKETAQGAQCLLFCLDVTAVCPEQITHYKQWLEQAGIQAPVVWVLNKTDLLSDAALSQVLTQLSLETFQAVSVKDGINKEGLVNALLSTIGYTGASQGVYMARSRHIAHLSQAITALEQVAEVGSFDLVAEQCRWAHNELGQIIGEVTVDDLLGKIFSEFCVGK